MMYIQNEKSLNESLKNDVYYTDPNLNFLKSLSLVLNFNYSWFQKLEKLLQHFWIKSNNINIASRHDKSF